MKFQLVYFTLILLLATGCRNKPGTIKNTNQTMTTDTLTLKTGYSDVNGLKMYYEIYGQGKPLVLVHGGGSNIETSFGRIIPELAKHRQVIAMDLQAHGRSTDRDAPVTFEQDADDVAALLKTLNISKADFLGFSNGATTALQIAIRHPQLVDKLIPVSALTKRSGAPEPFWEFMRGATLEQMPQGLKDEYIKVAPDPTHLQVMHDKDARRMVEFKDIPDALLQSIKAPTLLIMADQDVATPEHGVEMHRLIAGSRLMILPGRHGECIGEIITLKEGEKPNLFVVPLIEKFLEGE
jgi:pimeloyl-ACP methyl ester carboxylesterase